MRLLLLLVGLAAFAGASRDALKVKYQWKLMDFDWPEDRDYKNLFPDYKREDNLPLGLEVAGDRLFVTIPRWKRGVAATLAYINLNGKNKTIYFLYIDALISYTYIRPVRVVYSRKHCLSAIYALCGTNPFYYCETIYSSYRCVCQFFASFIKVLDLFKGFPLIK